MTATATTAPRSGRRLPPAAGALTAQVLLTAGSLVLQLVAARALGADGLGLFALLFGAIVMATAVSTGLIGDSLTVLDRHDPGVRSGLAFLTVVVVAVAASLMSGAALVAGWLGPDGCLWLAAATATFMLADLARRMLMAVQRFWRLVLVETAGIAATLTTLIGAWLLAGPAGLSVTILVAGLAVGQCVAGLVAWRCLPERERGTARLRPGSWRAVLGFGGWRSVQQFVRPTTLNGARTLVLAAAGPAAVGARGGPRLFVSPAMILIQGIASYLFASYAADRLRPLSELRGRADRAAAVMLAASALVGLAAAAAVPLLAEPLVGEHVPVSAAAVLGWGAYAASCAAVLPYGSLASVRGEQAKVLGLRVADAAASLALVAVALLVIGWPVSATPWLLSVGSFVGGLLCRQLLLAERVAAKAAPRTDEQVTR